jgi:hypothetical protein
LDFKLSYTEPNDIIWHNGPLLKEDTTQTRVEVTGQRLLIQLRTWLGEWFINTAYGIPYEQRIIAKKNISKAGVDLILQQQVLSDSGVREIVSWSSTLSSTRKYTLVFSIKVVDGTVSEPLTVNI